MNCKNILNFLIGRNTILELGDILSGKRVRSDSIAVFLIDQFFQILKPLKKTTEEYSILGKKINKLLK